MRSRTTVPSRFTRFGSWFVLALIALAHGSRLDAGIRSFGGSAVGGVSIDVDGMDRDQRRVHAARIALRVQPP